VALPELVPRRAEKELEDFCERAPLLAAIDRYVTGIYCG
jgi:hypothetical protein